MSAQFREDFFSENPAFSGLSSAGTRTATSWLLLSFRRFTRSIPEAASETTLGHGGCARLSGRRRSIKPLARCDGRVTKGMMITVGQGGSGRVEIQSIP